MRVIPNETSWIGFTTTKPLNLSAPKVSEITGATKLTGLVISITAQATGNSIPTPDLENIFETSIPGTTTGSFTADFYRDDEDDLAWETLDRGVAGYFLVSRFGGTGTNGAPAVGDALEVWPVRILSRTASAMASNTAQTFTCTAAVPETPVEDAIVVAT